jgi:hypothetical protein
MRIYGIEKERVIRYSTNHLTVGPLAQLARALP